jgi:3-deoxy-D-manno-octulosonic-acid transferase
MYAGLIRLAALRSPKAKQWLEGRRDWPTQLKKRLAKRQAHQPLYWMHCASLGEFEQGRPLLEALRQEQPHAFWLLTFFSPSGYEPRKHYDQAQAVAYLPLDSPSAAATFLDLVQPQQVFFVKYEFWYFYLQGLHQRGIPAYLISAQFRPNQVFFKPLVGSFFRKILGFFRLIFTQNQGATDLLARYGIPSHCAGDTRWDRVAKVRSEAKAYPLIEAFIQGQPTLVAGSAWPSDLPVLLHWAAVALPKGWKLIIAPHELGETSLKTFEQAFASYRLCRYTQCQNKPEGQSVMLLDTMGMLSSVYRYAQMAYIGGGFGAGIHNSLEAAIYRIPLAFGPKYQKFQEAVELRRVGLAQALEKPGDLLLFWQPWQDLSPQIAFQTKAEAYVQGQLGAVGRIVGGLTPPATPPQTAP